MQKRVFIIIDGNNFYHRLKELDLKNLLNFNYEKFAQFLVGKRKLVLKKYYIEAVREEPNPKSRELMEKKIEYIGFSHKPSYALIANSDIRRLLIKEELLEYFRSLKQNPKLSAQIRHYPHKSVSRKTKKTIEKW